MFVIKRDGTKVPIRYDSITDRNAILARQYNLNIDVTHLSQLVINGLKSGMTTSEIDDLSAETAFYQSCYEPDYDTLATRIAISNLHKSTSASFFDTMVLLHGQVNSETGKPVQIISDTFLTYVTRHKDAIEAMIDYERDNNYNYFGLKTLKKLYLLKDGKRIAERPQHMLMRVSIAIHLDCNDDNSINDVRETYDALSTHLFTHASPTLFNAGNARGNLSSCFLLDMSDDLEHIFETNKRCALISKMGGGIGINISKIRSRGSVIHSSNGRSDGIVPMTQCFNATARYSNQSGRRSGSFALYIEPSHPDIFDFLALRLPTPPDEKRARDMFLAMWMPDLFMQRLERNEMWSLFCPSVVPQLSETYGDAYNEIYLKAEEQKLYSRQVPAVDIWKAVCQSQQETGLPYILYKDSINRKSNQSNIGLIRSSNLCAEIVEYTDPQSVAVCNLASIALQKFVHIDKDGTCTYDFEHLGEIVKMAVYNLNKVIDKTSYPIVEAVKNNLDYRPIGLGVQGLADTFALFKTYWGSPLSKTLNRVIAEVMYYYALEASHTLAMRDGAYHGFEGSPISQGKLQYHLWGVEPITAGGSVEEINGVKIPRLDWDGLLLKCKQGVRNSLLIALMPTASSSQILGSTECFEPITSNIYTRSTNSGEFIIVNKHLYSDLKELGMWNRQMVNRIIAANGSIQSIDEIPDDIKCRYKTVWEISQKIIIDLAADRGAFVDQTQSMNLFVARPTYATLSSMHMYGWKAGLKTGSYYIRSKPARDAVKFTISSATSTSASTVSTTASSTTTSKFVCMGEEGCVSCSS